MLMEQILTGWREFLEEELSPRGCKTTSFEREQYWDEIGTGDNKRKVPREKQTTEIECELVKAKPEVQEEETEPLPQSELDKREREREKIRNKKERAKLVAQRKASWLKQAGSITEEDVEEAKKKPNCSAGNPNHSGDDGKFVAPEDEDGSWSLVNAKGSNCSRGQAQRKGKKQMFVRIKCGRGAKYRCRDGSEKW